ncbi:exodeoxyribonuclease VII large subunit [Thiomicrorhabdus sediminis]|uniref:Exodeoxyribonuclease 7 large subunit n=1 Tax=Thiomicrorhabdus sediminis TaxID=2580412 RepID=A0A4P9K5P5_9GAMM|nr:exodeoxyribonuclease VII large subunit [Thiomicrorhabdus sediminis]QCU90131.1 exodeoxyribonuclease VII large subunit [Thiomicrorhabdus sediminis]
MIFLDVPFREKDAAKSLGARWDAVSKRWYIPESFDGDMQLFSKWLPNENASNHPQADILEDVSSKPNDKGIRLSALMNQVQLALRKEFAGGRWVIAEIANINQRRGHIYLELTETSDNGQIMANCRAMIWQSQAGHLLQRFLQATGSELAIGQKVLLLVEVSFHEQYGFSLVVQDMDPSFTLGELEQNLAKIRQNLVKKGVYQNNKRFVLPTDFFRIAVIAPPEAAGLGDFRADADLLQKLKLCEFTYFYSSFQGLNVETEMLSALDAVHAIHKTKPFDALVIIRGGGAKLDLNQLNIETIAEQLCLAELPVMSGIGHERDNTILDEVSHSRFDTPSKVIGYIRSQITNQAKAAQTHWLQIEKSSHIQIKSLQHRLQTLHHTVQRNSRDSVYRWQNLLEPLYYQTSRLSQQHISGASQKLETLQQGIHSQLDQKVAVLKMNVEQANERVQIDALRAIDNYKQQIIQSIAFILSSGPKTQLNRGFNIAKDSQGKPVTSAEKARLSKHLELEFSDGSVKVDVKE